MISKLALSIDGLWDLMAFIVKFNGYVTLGGC